MLKEKFYEEIALLQKPDKVEVRAISKQQLDAIIDMLRNKTIKNNQYYYFSAHYRVVESDPPQLAAISDDEDNTTQKVVVCLEDMFDACMKIHISVGKSGREKMEKEGAKFYCNMTRKIIEIFLKYSKEYQLKRHKTKKHGLVVKPIKSDAFNSRMQIDLFDLQSLSDGEYKWILN